MSGINARKREEELIDIVKQMRDAMEYMKRDLMARAEDDDGCKVVNVGQGNWDGFKSALNKANEYLK